MAKRTSSAGQKIGTGVAVGVGSLALGGRSNVVDALVLGVVMVLALTVAVVVLTAARSSDRRKQRNSATVLNNLLRTIRDSTPDR
jgi:hypothetical protein